MKPISYTKHYVSEEDIEAVVSVLKSDFLTQGPIIEEFEKSFAAYVGSKYAVAVSNGTAALHLCALAVDIQPGDRVITTPLTFVATVNCIEYCRGEVVFSDIDPKTYLLDINKVRELLEASPRGTYKGIIPVDFAGNAVNLKEFRALADEFGIWIIEDACHAPGGYFIDNKEKRQKCGNGNFADLAIFSFHAAKHITCGEGGMITTNDKELYEKILMLRSHGISKNSKHFLKNDGGWYYEMKVLGYNYRISDINCALGLSQLKRAKQNLKKRKLIALRYIEAFKGTSIKTYSEKHHQGHAYHLFVIQVKDQLDLYNYLKKLNIYCQVHYIPTYKMPYYIKNYGNQNFPYTEAYYSSCLSLPIYPSLQESEQKFVIEKINLFFQSQK